MNKKTLASVAGLFFTFGNGFLFFAMNLAYREYKVPYPLLVIIVALLVGSFCVVLGAQLLMESVSKAKNK